LPASSCVVCIFNNCELNIGVSEIAVTVEVQTVIQTIQPNCLNKIPVIPVTNVKGKNTATVTSVVTITEVHTSLVPYFAASRGRLHRSTCFVMFSSTTMASSTTIPMAIESEEREMTFSDSPVANK